MKPPRALVIPPPVPPGGRIAVIAPGSPVHTGRLRAGLKTLAAWGFQPLCGPYLYSREGDLAGGDDARLKDLLWALTEPGIDAVWAARGGWGTPRLLARLDPRALLAASPRWVIGFSDLTALLVYLLELGIASWHAPLVSELGQSGRYFARDLQRMLGEPLAPRILRGVPLNPGTAQGPLAGGCLTLLAWLAGTPWQPDLREKILFVEEVGEAPYRIDRMLHQLRAAGVLRGLAGLACGQFPDCRAPAGRASRTLKQVLTAHARELGVPALAGLPFGHGPRARAIPLGFQALLETGSGTLRIEAPAL